MKIGEVAVAAGVSVRSLRYYEGQGLLHADRTSGGQRRYDPTVVDRVKLLQTLYSAGLTSARILELLPCVDTPSRDATAASVDVMRREHARLTHQIGDLAGARDQLGQILEEASAHLEPESRTSRA